MNDYRTMKLIFLHPCSRLQGVLCFFLLLCVTDRFATFREEQRIPCLSRDSIIFHAGMEVYRCYIVDYFFRV